MLTKQSSKWVLKKNQAHVIVLSTNTEIGKLHTDIHKNANLTRLHFSVSINTIETTSIKYINNNL